jgi:heme A synthase
MAGGLVNPTGSSLACPEAFVICHGELFPTMQGGVLYEHGHRLIAMTVGLLQLGLTILVWRRRPALRGWAAAALGLVAVQALLGALTVQFLLPWFVSLAHLMVAMTYFAMVLLQAWRMRPAGGSRSAAARCWCRSSSAGWSAITAPRWRRSTSRSTTASCGRRARRWRCSSTSRTAWSAWWSGSSPSRRRS